MLDNKSKQILMDEFSKEKNYNSIIGKTKKKQYKNKKLLEILATSCAILIVAILIPISAKNKKIANNQNLQKNGILVENSINNNENLNNDVSNNNETKENNEISSNTISDTKIAKEKIYKTIEVGTENMSLAYDITVPENIVNDHPENKYVVKVKILSVGEGEMLPKQENFSNSFSCYTPIKMQIIENLSSKNSLSGEITAYINGGKIKIRDILKGTPYQIECMGIYDANAITEDRYDEYIEYKWAGPEIEEPFFEPEIEKEYVIIINKTNPKLYQICCGGYGIFNVSKNSSGDEIYANVISNKVWKIKK